MDILTKENVKINWMEILARIRRGDIFIHPSDTIYGLGCNATDENAVKKSREIKQRPSAPFSIWVPSLEWIRANCAVDKETEKSLKLLPGPYTLILSLKNEKALAKGVINNKMVGIRYPNHWFGELVQKLGLPIITTSVNLSGDPFMTDVKDINPQIEQKTGFIIYEGKKEGTPSKVINTTTGEVINRKK